MGGSACQGGHYMFWAQAGLAPTSAIQADLGHPQGSGILSRAPRVPLTGTPPPETLTATSL